MSQPGKRLFDVVVGGGIFVLLLPLLLLISLMVRLSLGRPIFFKQTRIGLGERTFTIFKFRTMIDRTDEDGRLLPNHERLTSLGRWLRALSLDELPELWHVLTGEMSLVGPRPLLPHYLECYKPHERKRHRVRPGVTGWAQVNGRNLLSWDDRLAMDAWYVENWSMGLDVRILSSTIGRVLKRTGVAVDSATVERDLREERTGSRE